MSFYKQNPYIKSIAKSDKIEKNGKMLKYNEIKNLWKLIKNQYRNKESRRSNYEP